MARLSKGAIALLAALYAVLAAGFIAIGFGFAAGLLWVYYTACNNW